ncbi:PEP-CTERM sorting domain-containing protein [bacterium]|nr:PEP-CTERM sorting domain-containing protein [bacterium]
MKTSYPIFCLVLVTTTRGQIQIVDTSPGANQISPSGTYTQNFDSLTGTGAGKPWTDNATLPGWYVTDSTYTFGFGLSEGIYSLGYAGGQGDRALGARGSPSSTDMIFAVRFKNLTSSTLTNVSITFDGEQWNRQAATNQTASNLLFAYRVYNSDSGAIYSDVNDSGWTYDPALDFTSPNASLTAGSTLDGNAPENSVRGINALIDGFTLLPGQELWLRWGSFGGPYGIPIHGLGIDNLSVSFITAIPEPAAFAGLAGLGALGFALSRRRSRLG